MRLCSLSFPACWMNREVSDLEAWKPHWISEPFNLSCLRPYKALLSLHMRRISGVNKPFWLMHENIFSKHSIKKCLIDLWCVTVKLKTILTVQGLTTGLKVLKIVNTMSLVISLNNQKFLAFWSTPIRIVFDSINLFATSNFTSCCSMN